MRPLVLGAAVAASLASLPAAAGVTCQLLDPDGNAIGDGGADAGNDLGGQANALACGRNALSAPGATAVGADALASGAGSVALGREARAEGTVSLALGNGSRASHFRTIALGGAAQALNWGAVAVGGASEASGLFTVGIGQGALAHGDNSVALGGFLGDSSSQTRVELYTRSLAVQAVALGAAAFGGAERATALGTASQARGARSVALGAYSAADEADVVSLGHGADDLDHLGVAYGTALTRRLVNVADGIAASDAATLGQLQGMAGALGGGAGFSGGVFNAPSYVIQGTSHADIGSAFAGVDARLSSLQDQIDTIELTPGPQGPEGPQGPQGPVGPGSELAAEYDDPGRAVMTLGGSQGTRVANVADGEAPGDAVNRGQMDAGDAATLQSANGYTRASAGRTLDSANAYARGTADAALRAANEYTDSQLAMIDDRFEGFAADVDARLRGVDQRLDRIAAMSGAMSAAAMNTAGLAGRNRLGVGVGTQGGEDALAMGYQRLLGRRMSVSLSAGFAGGDSTAAAGAGISW
ncbi:YadA-like family protein [Luteimonas sp. RD2P54]|uniref:YadA-like family protein n=1 Tax=Luteimonas endophytica TaxID=3042023 RepID=A0ABT6J6H5_9GAMM|nr:YadA-like family protein [Luteimonas endophytica]MDH5822432.1 YadA-like family protein [Luteimonas endophytica]